MQKLKGKIAVITGGNSGIGFAIAARFVQEGAFVFITGRRQAELDKVATQLGKNIEVVQGDVTDPADLIRLFETIKARKGQIDILVTSAGYSEHSALDSVTLEHFDKIFDLNARGTLFTVQGALPLMDKGGTIVLIGSIAGSVGVEGYGVYAASKAAIRSLSRTWTRELAAKGIRINTLSPGPVDTPMFDGVSDEFRKAMTDLIPLGRLGKPEEIASAALFLASDESSYIAGAELCIDGGMTQV